MASHLHLKPRGETGEIHNVTPHSAGWSYVGFAVHRLAHGTTLNIETAGREVCIVPLSGTAEIIVKGTLLGSIGGRESPFDGPPSCAYVPPDSDFSLTATSACEIALCSAPAMGRLPARLIPPGDVGQETRGKASNLRKVANILPDTSPHAESLLVVEVITPSGNWSSYPPHKHDRDALPAESQLEETYYHRFNPAQGYAVQRVYSDDRTLDETFTVEDRDVVLVPRGYHPVGVAHGYDLFYLNVMAGPKRIWKFHNDPAHEWIMKA